MAHTTRRVDNAPAVFPLFKLCIPHSLGIPLKWIHVVTTCFTFQAWISRARCRKKQWVSRAKEREGGMQKESEIAKEQRWPNDILWIRRFGLPRPTTNNSFVAISQFYHEHWPKTIEFSLNRFQSRAEKLHTQTFSVGVVKIKVLCFVFVFSSSANRHYLRISGDLFMAMGNFPFFSSFHKLRLF